MSTIRSVDRCFAILQTVAQHPQGIGVTAIAAQLSLSKSTVSRLLATMQTWEVVEKKTDQRFCIGSEPARWVQYQQVSQTLAQRMIPILRTLANETGESAALCVLEGNQVVYQENVQSHQDVQMRDWRGERVPPHTVSPGKVLLAHTDDKAVAAYLSMPLVALTKKTVTDPQMIASQLATIRKQGFAIVDEEFGAGIVGMAIPIVNAPAASNGVSLKSKSSQLGKVVAALCVYGPKFRLRSQQKQKDMISLMQETLNTYNAVGHK